MLTEGFTEAIINYEKQKKKLLNKPNFIRRFFCAVNFHKWTFCSKEIEVKKRLLFFGTKTNEIGEERLYIYQCKYCEYSAVKIKGYTSLGDYEKWGKKLKHNIRVGEIELLYL